METPQLTISYWALWFTKFSPLAILLQWVYLVKSFCKFYIIFFRQDPKSGITRSKVTFQGSGYIFLKFPWEKSHHLTNPQQCMNSITLVLPLNSYLFKKPILKSYTAC